jgi:hypothetical protein
MPLVKTSLLLDSETLDIARTRGDNVSEMCRNHLRSHYTKGVENPEMIESEIAQLEVQKIDIDLQIKLLKQHLELLRSKEELSAKREAIFELRKMNLRTMYQTKSLDWNLLKDIFQFQNVASCKKWILQKLGDEGLI